MDVVPIASEKRAFLNLDLDVKIAIGAAIHAASAFAQHSHLLAVVDAGWDIDDDVFMDSRITRSAANMAVLRDDFSRPVAAWARPFAFHDPKKGLLSLPDVTGPTASGAGRDVIGRIRAGPVAVFAGFIICHRDRDLTAIDRVHEIDFDSVKGVLAFRGLAGAPLLTPLKSHV